MSNQHNAEAPIHECMLINGERVDGPVRLEVRNPARPNDLVGTIVRGTADHVNQAVAAAKGAQPVWAARSFIERAEILDKALGRLQVDIESRASVLVRENGKPLAEASGELLSVPRRQRMALAYASELEAGRSFAAPRGRTFVVNRPYGVVVSIVPWNSPVSLAFTQIVAALLAGNCVVVKPPESCPLSLIRAVQLFAEELPPGAVNAVTGLPSEIGDALTTHADVGKIGFTGSIPSARHIMANAAQSIKGITLELGGNDPAIILEDADLGAPTMETMLGATFQMTGQVCMAIKRIYVPTRRRDEFVDAFARAAESIVLGDGLKPGVTMGPLHSQQGQRRAYALLEDAVRRGAKTRELGKIDNQSTFDEGYFIRPVIVTDVPDDAPLMAEEQFCPAIPVTTYDDLEDAISRANDTIYGLSGSVWSRNTDRAVEIARRIEAGQVWVNTHGPTGTNHLAPYGGVKQSGIGRKSGIEGILEYLQSQTITTHDC
jgi:acyl-CoA reductase-like NAD-dependent aldehyde dehydrogenase